jgi:hypothetical protein
LPAKDRYHDTVKHALVKDSWTITGEHVKIGIENRALYIDIEATSASAHMVVLIEVKELEDVLSPIEALAHAYGKYALYRLALDDAGRDINLYLAVTQAAYQGILSEKIGKLAIANAQIALMIFDPEREEIVEWIP